MCVDTLRRAAPLRALRAERLAEDNVRLVYHLVIKVCEFTDRDTRWPDAVGTGMIALVNAARAWVEWHNEPFGKLATIAVCRELERWRRKEWKRGFSGVGDKPDAVERVPKVVMFSTLNGRLTGGLNSHNPWGNVEETFSRDGRTPEDSPAEVAEGRVEAEAIAAVALKAATPKQADVLRRVTMGDETVSGLAAEKGLSRQAIGARITHGLERIRKRLNVPAV